MSIDRFDLEQAIMDCWNVVSDIRTLSEEVVEGNLSKDQIANVLVGLDQLYDIKFNKLFRIFEEIVSQISAKEIEFRNTKRDVEDLLDEVRALKNQTESSNNPKYDSNDDETMGLRLVEDEKVPF